MKRIYLFPICYLCIYTWTEKDTKAILMRSSHGLESARNVGRIYTQLQQLLLDISPVCSFNIMYVIVNNSSEDARRNSRDFFLNLSKVHSLHISKFGLLTINSFFVPHST